MFLALAPNLSSDFPEATIMAIIAEGLNGAAPWPIVDKEVADLTALAASGSWQPRGEEHPAIASWHAAYRKFGTNPRRFRPSLEALERRLGKSKSFPRVLPAVDAYNLISLRYGFPAGAFDLTQVHGDISIRYGQAGDEFTAISSTEGEAPKSTEVVYADGVGVLTRHWNHRDAQRTCVTEASTSVLFLLEAMGSDPGVEALAAASQDLVRLLEPHTKRLGITQVSAGQLSADLDARR